MGVRLREPDFLDALVAFVKVKRSHQGEASLRDYAAAVGRGPDAAAHRLHELRYRGWITYEPDYTPAFFGVMGNGEGSWGTAHTPRFYCLTSKGQEALRNAEEKL